MKRTMTLLAAIATTLAFAFANAQDRNDNNTVAVCKNPGDPGQRTVMITPDEVDFYLKEGARLGECDDTQSRVLSSDGVQP